MEQLFTPHIGLTVWTIVTFLILVFILGRYGWKPLIRAIEEREEKIKKDLDAARENREQMERLKRDYEQRWIELEERARKLLSEAEQKGLALRETILKDAETEARKLQEKSRQQLQAEKERLTRELRQEVGELSIMMAEKLMRQTIDKKVQEKFIQDFLKNLDTPPGKIN